MSGRVPCQDDGVTTVSSGAAEPREAPGFRNAWIAVLALALVAATIYVIDGDDTWIGEAVYLGFGVIAVTGYAQPDDVKKAVAAGFDAHVAKPPDPAEINRLLGFSLQYSET